MQTLDWENLLTIACDNVHTKFYAFQYELLCYALYLNVIFKLDNLLTIILILFT